MGLDGSFLGIPVEKEDKWALAWLQGALRGSQMMLFLKARGKGNEELQLFAFFLLQQNHARQTKWLSTGDVEWRGNCGGSPKEWEVKNHMLSLERCTEKAGREESRD